MRFYAIFIIMALPAACTTLPDIPEPLPSQRGDGEYQPLVPLGEIARGAEEQDESALQSEEIVAARVAGLRARANRLRDFQFN